MLIDSQSEQRALGALMMVSDARRLIAAHGLTADLFEVAGHGAIFTALKEAADALAVDMDGATVNPEDVAAVLDAKGQAEECGGLAYLARLSACVITARNFGNDVQRIRAAAVRRRAVAETERALSRLRDGGEIADAVDALVLDLQQVRAASSGSPGAGLFNVVPLSDLTQAEDQAASFWWDDYLPASVVTILGAHGGTGKSTLALMLAVCIATGRPLFGVPTRRGVVAFFSGEDPAELIRARLRRICVQMGIEPAELDGQLHALDATIADPVLFHEVTAGSKRIGATTPTYESLSGYLTAHHVDVLIVDNASDTFDASEIDRAKVRAFMRSLARLAHERAGAVLLLAHVDKGAARGDRGQTSEGYSGSTAWHNSARSRLYLSRDKDGGLRLEHQKNNLGRMREPLALEWREGGLPQAVEAMSPTVHGIADRSDSRALLALLHEFAERGEFVATGINSPSNAARVLGGQQSYPKRKPAQVFDLLRDAERRGHLERAKYRNGDRKERERWALTAAGCAFIGVPAPSAPSAPTAEHGAISAGSAPSAPTPAGGVGGRSARTEHGAEAHQ